MSAPFSSTDWYHKYKMMKKKYNELHRVRVLAVEEDIITIKSRIEEHRSAHTEMMNEIRLHTEDLHSAIQTNARMKEEIRSMQDNIKSLQRILRCRDSILNVLIDYPDLRVRLTKTRCYRVATGPRDAIEFGLTKDDVIRYVPLKVPAYREIPEQFQQEFEMSVSDLHPFCRAIANIASKLKAKF
jgi:hypothetical protein